MKTRLITIPLLALSCIAINQWPGQAVEKPRDHGIGGTGIMGMITGFGSIFVNGYEVDIKPSQKIESDIENTGAQKLKLGQIVHVIAQGSGKHISANQVVIEHELIGPISALDSAKHQATILGQTVDVSKIPANQKLDIGQWVGVSGLRNATGTIQASLIEAAPVGTFKIIGNATELAPVLDSSQGLAIDRAEITGRISIRGHLSTDGTFIESYQPWSYFPQQDKLSRVSLEGFFNTQVGAALDLTADDIRADASEDETGQIFRHLFDSVIKNVAPPDTSTSPVIVTATVKDNVLTVQTITPTSPNASKATPIPKITGAVEDGPVTLPQSSTSSSSSSSDDNSGKNQQPDKHTEGSAGSSDSKSSESKSSESKSSDSKGSEHTKSHSDN